MTFAGANYEVLPGFLNPRALERMQTVMLKHWHDERNESQRLTQEGDLVWRQTVPEVRALHKLALPKFREITRRSLRRHSATFRCYQPGDHLNGHVDAYPISVSVSIAIHQQQPKGYPGWPLWMDGVGDIFLKPGDAIIFSQQRHGRDPFDVEAGLYIQATLFYQDGA